MKIEVYTRPGVIVTNNNDNGWFLVQTAQVTGQGKGLPTSLPDFTYPVAMPANSKQSFYVTSSDGAGDVWYGLGQQLGQAYATDDNLSLLEGYSVSYRFVASSGPRRWNGKAEKQRLYILSNLDQILTAFIDIAHRKRPLLSQR